MKIRLLIVFVVFTAAVVRPHYVMSQATISVDVNQVIKTIPAGSYGMNVNYLMDGSYISATTTTATTAALKTMNSKLLRYPGGEKSDNYYWSAAPYDKANPSVILTGPCQFPSNDSRFVQADQKTSKPEVLDFDEFMVMARAVGDEPMLVCAYDAAYYGGGIDSIYPCGKKPTLDQLITTAKEWVRYANKTKNYNIKYWCIGNESWNNCLYNGCVTPDQYAIDIVKFATAMRSVDPTIKIIANGLGSVWWQKLVTNPAAASAIDFLGVSCYPVYNYSAGYDEYRNNNFDLRDDLKVAADAITNFASAADKSRIKVIATEYNAIDWSGVWVDINDVGHALVSAEILGQSMRTPEVESMLFWNTRWTDNVTKPNDIYDALNKNSGYNASGLMLSAMYNNILSKMVKVTEEGKIKTFAYYDNTTSKLNVILINKDNTSLTANISVAGFSANATCVRWEYKGTDMNDTQPTYSMKDSVTVSQYPYLISLPRNSITVLKMSAANITLPLPLISFMAILQTNGYGHLTWQTSAGDNATSFAIERSTDSVTWLKIGTVAADGTSYVFDDPNPFPTGTKAYYRIVKTSATGQPSISDVRSIQKAATSSLTIKLLTNPAQESANFSISGIRYAALKINLLDSKGRLVRVFAEVASDGLVTLDLKGVPSGIYFVHFISAVAEQTFKMVKK